MVDALALNADIAPRFASSSRQRTAMIWKNHGRRMIKFAEICVDARDIARFVMLNRLLDADRMIGSGATR